MKLNEVKQIGNYETDRTWDNPQTGRVYSPEGLSPTLNTCGGGGHEVKIVEPMIVASRGRNKDNPSDRTPGNHVEQRLEPNSQGICNTLTSVQKDNLLLEPTVKIKQATKEGYIECKLGGVADLSYPESKTRRGRVQDNGDTCSTLTATETGVCRIEKAPITTTKGKTDIACTQMANYYRSNMSGFVTENAVYETPYRIRKLTPLECWRLMDFTDEDFHKAEEVNSNTQLYKQAGNSIVKAVLMAIFKQML